VTVVVWCLTTCLATADPLRAVGLESQGEQTGAETISPIVPTETTNADQILNSFGQPGAPNLFWGDTKAQWVKALTGLLALALNILAVVLLYRTLMLTRATLQEAEKATLAAIETVAVTRSVGEAQVRAYLSIVESNAVFGDDDSFELRMTVRNNGQTPAKGVHAVMGIMVGVAVGRPIPELGEVTASHQVFTRPIPIGDIAAGQERSVGSLTIHDIEFPPRVVRRENGTIAAGSRQSERTSLVAGSTTALRPK
jgi:hypothetical protein